MPCTERALLIPEIRSADIPPGRIISRRSRNPSVLPGILIHFTNNAMSISLERIAVSQWEGASSFVRVTEAGPVYQPLWIVVSAGVAITVLLYFGNIRSCVDEDDVDRIDFDDRSLVDPAAALAV